MALGRLHPSDEYDIRIAVEEGEGGSLDGKWVAMLVDEIEHYSGEKARLTSLLAERDAEIARLVGAGQALASRSPCFLTIRPTGDIETCQFCLEDNGHAPGCEWVAFCAALAARGGEVQG